MRHVNVNAQKRQSGLSLIELMIALVLGLVVVSAVFNTFLGSSRSARFSQGLGQLQENGRYGITTLQRGIRMAGYSPEGDLAEPFDIAASDDSTIVVQLTNTYDCNGQLTDGVGGIAINTYTHDDVAKTITCEGNVGGAPMDVVEGVEAMRFLWGIDSDDDGIPEHYKPHDLTIEASNVVAMRVAILVSSGKEAIRSRSSEETHVLFNEEIITEGKVAYHVFSTTVELRNKPDSY